MSNITSTSAIVAQEQLFTELTAEEGAVIEGGAVFTLHNVYTEKAGADGFLGGEDDLYMNFYGQRIFRRDMGTREFASVEKSFYFNGDTPVQLYDDDAWPNPDDFLGQHWISSSTPVNKRWQRIEGGGSVHWIQYSVA